MSVKNIADGHRHLEHNQLSGQIPPEIGLLSSLHRLRLGGNNFTGPIPPEIGAIRSLSNLNLNDNQLSGPIPRELALLTELRELALSNNQLCSDPIFGPIPPELGQMTQLHSFDLSDNQLSGPIPLELLQLRSNFVNLARNDFLFFPEGCQVGDEWNWDVTGCGLRPARAKRPRF